MKETSTGGLIERAAQQFDKTVWGTKFTVQHSQMAKVMQGCRLGAGNAGDYEP